MGSINLYRIDEQKQQDFIRELSGKMTPKGTIELETKNAKDKTVSFGVTLYMNKNRNKNDISWNWVLSAFNQPEINVLSSPKAILLIEKDDDTTYAVTFGHSYFMADKFCDKDFGFNFARKLSYKEIKTTTLTTPSSRRNKTVNTYINYNELEFDSGESFAKLKATVDLPDDFTLYKPAIEIGSSIKFVTSEDSIDTILKLIIYVENVILTKKDKYQIPVFTKINDELLIKKLDESLLESIKENPAQINISELDIIGATEIFNHNDSNFLLKYNRKEKSCTSLTSEEIQSFCVENGFEYNNVVLDISVVSYYNGDSIATKRVKELIDYTDDVEKCMLSKGVWYKYNEDYLNYLKDSLAEINAEYHEEFDFSDEIHNAFINSMYQKEKNEPQHSGKSESDIKKALKRKYYAERAFNLIMESENGYSNFDRNEQRVGDSTIEVMDLYKDGVMCAVKIGNTSAKLCYAVDQSLTALKLYKKGYFKDIPNISTVALWFVLERQGHIENADGIPDINSLEMLMLKNRLDQWKKEVRVQGFKPLIYINYRTN